MSRYAPYETQMVSWGGGGGSPPRPGSGHLRAPGQSLALLDGGGSTNTLHPRGSHLDSGLGNVRACQLHQCLRHPGTAYTLWLHDAGHCPAPGGTEGLLHS